MKKIIASCAVMALFAQFTDAKVAGKAAQTKDIKTVDAEECNCGRDPFAGGYVSFGLGYGSTKDKLESDLTVAAQSGSAEDDDGYDAIEDGLTVANAQNYADGANEYFDSVTVMEIDAAGGNGHHVATVIGKKNTKKNKSHHNMIGSVAAGWLWKVGGNGYLGLEGSVGFGSNSITSLQYIDINSSDEAFHIDLKRPGTNLGVSGVLGWNVAQSYLLYGKVGVRANSVEVVPSLTGSYSKKIFAPEFGLGFKKVMNNSKATVGLEASYVLNKKIKMNDKGKEYTVVPFGNADSERYDTIGSLIVQDGAAAYVGDEDAQAVVKSKRTGTWKVALTLTMPIA